METYCTSDMTDAEITTLREKIRKERWVWTCNGMVLPHDEEEFAFLRTGYGDMIGLLFRKGSLLRRDIPVMG